jgi:hypothetical protein
MTELSRPSTHLSGYNKSYFSDSCVSIGSPPLGQNALFWWGRRIQILSFSARYDVTRAITTDFYWLAVQVVLARIIAGSQPPDDRAPLCLPGWLARLGVSLTTLAHLSETDI